MSEQESSVTYKVVVNHEEQYSIWPADRANALGWRDVGFSGTKAESLAYINEHWTDMRPLSLRQQMSASNATTTPDNNAPTNAPVESSPVPTASVAPNEPTTVATSEAPPVPVAVASEAPPKQGFFSRLFGGGNKKS